MSRTYLQYSREMCFESTENLFRTVFYYFRTYYVLRCCFYRANQLDHVEHSLLRFENLPNIPRFETCGKRVIKTRFHPPLTGFFFLLYQRALCRVIWLKLSPDRVGFPFSALTLFPGLFTVPLMRMKDLLSRLKFLN